MKHQQQGAALVTVLATIVVSLIFATTLLYTSISQGGETRAQQDRSQAELLCVSMIELAKLKIKLFPTDLYTAFHYLLNVPDSEKDESLYDAFIADLNIADKDYKIAVDGTPWQARVTKIERLGITKSDDGIGVGYVKDFYRITVEATVITTGHGFEELETKMQMQTSLAIEKKE